MKPSQRITAEGMLFTDKYQLTMAQLYFRTGMHEKRAQFDCFFRSYPDYGQHKAGYCVNAGLEWALDWMGEAQFCDEDIEYLRSEKGPGGTRTYDDDFLTWLHDRGTFEGITINSIPEGRVVHPDVPVAAIEGPLAMAQILESPFLNHVNYQTLIATKASRIKTAAHGQPMIDFGMRRAHGKGANAGARAALIGGADFTSNTGISHALGYPPKGTHAHSMVQVYIALGEGELTAFRKYAEVYPDECVLLVDTIDTLGSGLPNAITVFEELRRQGHTPLGIRLDSGDLAYLSIQSAKMLDDAGFPDTRIVLSNRLDELVIWQIMRQIEDEAPRSGVDPQKLIKRLSFGVGTGLVTSTGDSALDGVYKLVAVENNGKWAPAFKISESAEKTLNPGHKNVWRLYDQRGKAIADVLGCGDVDIRRDERITLHHPTDHSKHRTLRHDELSAIEPLHVEIMKDGVVTGDLPSIEQMRESLGKDLDRLDEGVKRLMNPHIYHVSLTDRLWSLKNEFVDSTRADISRETNKTIE